MWWKFDRIHVFEGRCVLVYVDGHVGALLTRCSSSNAQTWPQTSRWKRANRSSTSLNVSEILSLDEVGVFDCHNFVRTSRIFIKNEKIRSFLLFNYICLATWRSVHLG